MTGGEADDETMAAEVAALFAIVKARYGARLDEAQLEGVRKAIEAIVEQARVVRAVRLGNADEPYADLSCPTAPTSRREPRSRLFAAARARGAGPRAPRLAGGPGRALPRPAREARAALQRGGDRDARAGAGRGAARRGARSPPAATAGRSTASRTAPRISSPPAAASRPRGAPRRIRDQRFADGRHRRPAARRPRAPCSAPSSP